MMGLSVLVVDDEPLARRRISRMLRKLDWVETIMEAGNTDEAWACASNDPPDVLLLDIQMPGGDGFKLIERWNDNLPAVIFVTAFDHHALRAFEVGAADYVTKPIEPGRLYRAMERARSATESQLHADRLAELNETVASLKLALGTRDKRSCDFWVKSQGDYVRVDAEEIVWVQADRDYVRLHAGGAAYLYQDSLSRLEQKLDPSSFMRVHRSAIVKRSAIVRIKTGSYGSLILGLTDGAEVRVGRTYTQAIKTSLSKSE